MEFLNKLYNKVIFSNAPELNLGATDMGEEQCSVNLTEESVKRLRTATGTVGSLEIFVPVEMTVAIDKTSPNINYWKKRYLENGYIGGSVTVYDDTNYSYTATKPSIIIDSLGNFNGTDPVITFKVSANFRVNTTALAGFNI